MGGLRLRAGEERGVFDTCAAGMSLSRQWARSHEKAGIRSSKSHHVPTGTHDVSGHRISICWSSIQAKERAIVGSSSGAAHLCIDRISRYG